MTDRDLMVESIQNAVLAIDRAHEVSEQLKRKANPENFDAFRAQMLALAGELETIKAALEHVDVYAEDEVIDWLSGISSGHDAPYHRMTHLAKK
jgi:hypothetical protein